MGFRPIRSFVHRQKSLSKRQQSALHRLLTTYSLAINQEPWCLKQVFTQTATTTLEIGFGMGHNLLRQAQQYPEQNFLGIEVYRPGIAAILLGIERFQLSNVKIIYADAAEVLDKSVPDQSLGVIQIFFPDPWPKRRHHKRRLIQPGFARLLQAKLSMSGQLQLATDWEDYATQMLCVLENTPGLKNSAGKNKFSTKPIQRSPTDFEQRGQRRGHLIWDLAFYATV